MQSGKWNIQLRIGGQSISITKPTKRECEVEAAAIKTAWETGGDLNSTQSNLTVYDAMDRYIQDRSNVLSPSTIRCYKVMRDNAFQEIAGRKVKSIKDNEWAGIVNREAKTKSAKTLKNEWMFLRSALKIVCGKTVKDVRMPQVVRNERPFLDSDQIKLFLDAVKGEQIEVAALLALHSLRLSEILAMRWENIDLENGKIHVSGSVVYDESYTLVYKGTNKNKTSNRVIPIMIPRLKELLEEQKKPSGLVCPGSPNNVPRKINKVCDKAGLPHVGTHGLRHSFASLCYHLDVPEKVVMQLGGWGDDGTMRRIYTHISEIDKRKNENQIANFFANC